MDSGRLDRRQEVAGNHVDGAGIHEPPAGNEDQGNRNRCGAGKSRKHLDRLDLAADGGRQQGDHRDDVMT